MSPEKNVAGTIEVNSSLPRRKDDPPLQMERNILEEGRLTTFLPAVWRLRKILDRFPSNKELQWALGWPEEEITESLRARRKLTLLYQEQTKRIGLHMRSRLWYRPRDENTALGIARLVLVNVVDQYDWSGTRFSSYLSVAIRNALGGYVQKESARIDHTVNFLFSPYGERRGGGAGLDDVLEYVLFDDSPLPQKLPRSWHPSDVERIVVEREAVQNVQQAATGLLTPKQQQVFDLLVQGLNRDEICEELDINNVAFYRFRKRIAKRLSMAGVLNPAVMKERSHHRRDVVRKEEVEERYPQVRQLLTDREREIIDASLNEALSDEEAAALLNLDVPTFRMRVLQIEDKIVGRKPISKRQRQFHKRQEILAQLQSDNSPLLNKLTLGEQEILELHLHESMSTGKISKLLGMPASTARSRLGMAYKKLGIFRI